MTVEEIYKLALEQHQSGRLRQAEPLYRQVLAAQPDHADAIQMLGVLAHQLGNHSEALELLARAIALNGTEANYHANLGLVLANLGRLDNAVAAYRRAIELCPDHIQASVNLAHALLRTGEFEEAARAYERALSLRPDDAESWNNLGGLYRRVGQLPQAVGAYRRAISLRPEIAGPHYNLANALRDQGRRDEAIAAYRQAVMLRPDFADAHNNLGNALIDAGRTQEAIAAYRDAASAAPGNASFVFNLANALADAGRPDDAIASYRKAIALQPDHADAHNNLGKVLKDTGQLDEAMDCYRRAIAIDPNSPAADNLLFAAYLHPGYDARRIHEEHARWNDAHAAAVAAFMHPHVKDSDTPGKLRIGYVSPDFRNHVVGLNVLPLLREHDRNRFEIVCYSNVPRPDAITSRFQSYADAWRDIRALDDEQAAQMVRADRIDILVDLALHSAHHRLMVFARKPAPIQATFAGYPGTTGLRTIDYRITDPYLDPPPMNDAFYSEQSILLPHSFWCYDAAGDDPAVNELPAIGNGWITFGCLNRFCKINPAVLKLWAQVMRQIAGSRLLLLGPPGNHRRRTLDLLSDQQIAAGRIEFLDLMPREQYLRAYQRIDIALDTFPYNGHTTSLDALWMGVAVVTLIGNTAAGRAGWSQLSNLGLPRLAARSEQAFVQIAAALAGDLVGLADLRRSLRGHMRDSPLTDARGFARGVEAAYEQMWRDWQRSR